MKTVWLLVALILVVLVVGCSKPVLKMGDVSINPKDGAEMVWVPEGEFLMGSSDAEIAKVEYPIRIHMAWWLESEKPQHNVYLDGYWIYKNEVTVVQYLKFCSETGKKMPTAPDWGWIDSHPIVNVTWQDAADYAKWAGALLPTEAQWEKAARGTVGRIYPWGNVWDASKCNNGSTGPKKTQPVGSYAAGVSPYGCLDMAGNVWEWCADWYDANYYKNAPARNPAGPASSNCRVLRGGSWEYPIDFGFRCARRNRNLPDYRHSYRGFRCARTP